MRNIVNSDEIAAALARVTGLIAQKGEGATADDFEPDDKALVQQLFKTSRRGNPQRRWLQTILPSEIVPYGNSRMRVSPRENFSDMQIWLTGQLYEPQSQAALAEHIQGRRCLICDIGSNAGSYTVRMAELAGPGSRILAFDPNPKMVARLTENLTLNKLEEIVTIHQVALSDRVGEATLSIPPGNYGEATLGRSLRRVGETLTVGTAPLADFVTDRAAYERFVIKIDVEGHEDRVLFPFLDAVADGLLPDAILIETKHHANWGQDLMGLFGRRGYHSSFEAEGNTLFVRNSSTL
jgi:FkbM family methyltransferase